jgi:dTDP-4-amino-2,3,4,6-tetradeoxy-D-glucose N,N-dimethyltransferase
MYGREVAEVYDIIYRQRKDYPAEADGFAEVITERRPDAQALLDVACGTGEHLVHLQASFSPIEGLDMSTAMCEAAREKLPDVTIHEADMRSFDLDRGFDAVISPFSSIAHAVSVEELDATVACMARHLRPSGVLAVEPWLFPETLAGARPQMQTATTGQLGHDVVEDEGRVVSTVSHFALDDRVAHMSVHYLYGEADGVRHFTDTLDMTLFTRGEYESAFDKAGCDVEFLEGPPWARGVFVGVTR